MLRRAQAVRRGPRDAARPARRGRGAARAIAVALAGDYGCTVAGVDAAREMVAAAEAKRIPGTEFVLAPAEELPFPDGAYERALMRSAAHHLDRARAFPEARRALTRGSRLVLEGIDRDGLDELWYVPLFAPLLERERARIPAADDLRRELRSAGFDRVRIERLSLPRTFSRETALRKLRGRHTSSFDLLAEGEYAAGVARAEAELPAEVRYTLRSLVVVADAD